MKEILNTHLSMNNILLQLNNIEAGYGKKQILFGLSMEVYKKEIIAIIGPNGAGKSTLLKTVFGLLSTKQGKIIYKSCDIKNRKPSFNVADGINFVPQGNRVFDELTVLENLEIGGYQLNGNNFKARCEEIFNLFPLLKEHQNQNAASLSGGEKQILALGRALINKPQLLLLDEPSLGLSPKLVNLLMKKIKEINQKLNISILIVEQKVHEVLSICDRVYLLKLGRVAFHGSSRELTEDNKMHKLYLS